MRKEMKNKARFLVIAVVALFSLACGKKGETPPVKTEVIEGITHVYNTENPVRGRFPLEAVEVLRIDPAALDSENPPLFGVAVKDVAGNLYLADAGAVRALKLDARGALLARFLRKGEGPGEFPRFGGLQIAGDRLWVIGNWPMKIAEFTLDGEYVREWKFRTIRNFYLQTQVIDESRFLTVRYRDRGENQAPVRVSALIDPNEAILTTYYEDEQAGIFRIRTGQAEGPAVASTNPLIAADIHQAYDRHSGVVYVCNNRDYVIQAKNLDGTARLVIHKACRNIALDADTKDGLFQLIAPKLPPEARLKAGEQLPAALNAIFGLAVLPNGNLAVTRITGLESVEIDVFDADGRFLATVLPSASVPDLRSIVIYGETIGVIADQGEKTYYLEFKTAAMKGILF